MLDSRERRWVYLMVFLLLAAALAFEALDERWRRPPDPRFPALRHVDERLERSLRDAWPETAPWKDDADGERAAFASLAREHGADAARAILRILVLRYRNAGNHTDSYAAFFQDEEREFVGWLLGEIADERAKRIMVRALPERDFHPAFRRTLAVALCRPGNDIGPLLERVLDRQEDNGFRERLLVRLPRLEVPAPPELRDLLYQPFGRLDVYAAATLARMGDPEAPSLVLEGFDYVGWDDGFLYHLVLAAERITGRDIPFSKNASAPGTGREVIDRWHEKRAARHKAVLAGWLDGREPDTEYERGYRAYLAGDQRRREDAIETFDDVLRAGDDFDLAAASILLTGYRKDTLSRLERLARYLARKLDGVDDPARAIGILNRWLLKRNRNTDAMVEQSGRLSFLPHVLAQDAGHCVGYSTLYLALAERLDLPLHGVLVPGHCFVRYDDGAYRRNIETTDLGAAHPDDRYGGGIALRNRTKREVLSAILGNYMATCLFYSRFEEARLACDRALRLDPANEAALSNYAQVLYHSDRGDPGELLKTLREVRAMRPRDPGPLLMIAAIHREEGDDEVALELLREAVRLEDSARTRAALARCLAKLGRFAEARAALGRERDAPSLRGAERAILLRERPADSIRIVEERIADTREPLTVLADSASVLLDAGEPERALAVLQLGEKRANRPLKDEWLARGSAFMIDAHAVMEARQVYHLLHAKALHALGRAGAAREALAKAGKEGGSSRLMLEVRDLLR